MSKKTKAEKRIAKESAKLGRRIWRQMSRELSETAKATPETAITTEQPATPLSEMDAATWRRYTQQEWTRRFNAMGHPGVPNYWRPGGLSANVPQQPPAP